MNFSIHLDNEKLILTIITGKKKVNSTDRKEVHLLFNIFRSFEGIYWTSYVDTLLDVEDNIIIEYQYSLVSEVLKECFNKMSEKKYSFKIGKGVIMTGIPYSKWSIQSLMDELTRRKIKFDNKVKHDTREILIKALVFNDRARKKRVDVKKESKQSKSAKRSITKMGKEVEKENLKAAVKSIKISPKKNPVKPKSIKPLKKLIKKPIKKVNDEDYLEAKKARIKELNDSISKSVRKKMEEFKKNPKNKGINWNDKLKKKGLWIKGMHLLTGYEKSEILKVKGSAQKRLLTKAKKKLDIIYLNSGNVIKSRKGIQKK